MLRSNPQKLSKDDVRAILKKHDFYCRESPFTKGFSNPSGRGFAHQYQSQTIQGDQVVIDQASGLIWQQGGSEKSMDYYEAKNWITNLNQRGYAGHKDWRLPTIEEAMSLMRRGKKHDNLYIDPVFNKIQRSIWTADSDVGSASAWAVLFSDGFCCAVILGCDLYVRAVRSEHPSQETAKSESILVEQSLTCTFQKPQCAEAPKPAIVKPLFFRSQPQPLSEKDVQAIIKKHDFYCREYGSNEAWCNPNGHGSPHQYHLKAIQGDQVVVDQVSGLIWQQGGSDKFLLYEIAKEWIENLNKHGFAGYKDWRLPTLEEAMSLMEPVKKSGNLYIDPIFNKTQWWIWTADAVFGHADAWVVNFGSGCCYRYDRFHYLVSYVRAVRSSGHL